MVSGPILRCNHGTLEGHLDRLPEHCEVTFVDAGVILVDPIQAIFVQVVAFRRTCPGSLDGHRMDQATVTSVRSLVARNESRTRIMPQDLRSMMGPWKRSTTLSVASRYLIPDALDEKPRTFEPCDVWNLGILVWELMWSEYQ